MPTRPRNRRQSRASYTLPRTAAAYIRYHNTGDKHQWVIGDTLVAECGPPGEHGVNTGSQREIDDTAYELRSHGFQVTGATLRAYRQISSVYPDALRIASVSFAVHRVIGDSELLQRFLERYPDAVNRTEKNAKAFRKEYIELEQALITRQRQAAAGEAAQSDPQPDASTLRNSPPADAEPENPWTGSNVTPLHPSGGSGADANAQTPATQQSEPPRPTNSPMISPNSLVGMLSLQQKLNQLNMLSDDLLTPLERGQALTPEIADLFVEEALSAQQKLHKIIDLARGQQTTPRSHITLIEGE